MRSTAVGLAVLSALALLAGCWTEWGCQSSADCESAEVCRDHVCYPVPTPAGYGATPEEPNDAGDVRTD
jgi:hypothetical protein